MFTGIVQAVGSIAARGVGRDGTVSLTVEAPFPTEHDPLIPGESIAVDGACLTVVEAGADRFTAELGPETLRVTTLSAKEPGEAVNLERALRAGDRIGGHFVLGHVDGVGTVVSAKGANEGFFLEIAIPEELGCFVAPKGSIAIEGVSLTVVEVQDARFRVMIVPYTAAQTTIGRLGAGHRVNVEVDVLARYVLGQREETLR